MKCNIKKALIIFINIVTCQTAFSRVDRLSTSHALLPPEKDERKAANLLFQGPSAFPTHQSVSIHSEPTQKNTPRASMIYAQQPSPDRVNRTYDFLRQPEQPPLESRHSFSALPTTSQKVQRALWDETITLDNRHKQSATYQEMSKKLARIEAQRTAQATLKQTQEKIKKQEEEKNKLLKMQEAKLKEIQDLKKIMENDPVVLPPEKVYNRLQKLQEQLKDQQKIREDIQQQIKAIFPLTSIGIQEEIEKQQNIVENQKSIFEKKEARLTSIKKELAELPDIPTTINILEKKYINLDPIKVKELSTTPLPERNKYLTDRDIISNNTKIETLTKETVKIEQELSKLNSANLNRTELTQELTKELQKNKELNDNIVGLRAKITSLKTTDKNSSSIDYLVNALPLPKTSIEAYSLNEIKSLEKQLMQFQEEKKESDQRLTSLKNLITNVDSLTLKKSELSQLKNENNQLLLNQAYYKIHEGSIKKDDLIALTSNHKRKLLQEEKEKLNAESQNLAKQILQRSTSIKNLQKEANSPQTREKEKEIKNLINQQATITEQIEDTEKFIQSHKMALETYTSSRGIPQLNKYSEQLEELKKERDALQYNITQNATALKTNNQIIQDQEKILQKELIPQKNDLKEESFKREEEQEVQLKSKEEAKPATKPEPLKKKRKLSQKTKDFLSNLKSKTKKAKEQAPSIYKERVATLQKITSLEKTDTQEEQAARQAIEKETNDVQNNNQITQKEIDTEVNYLNQLKKQENVPAGIIQLKEQQVSLLQSIQSKEKQKQDLLTSFYWLTPAERRGNIASLRQEALKLTQNGEVPSDRQEEFDLYYNLIRRHAQELESPTPLDQRFKKPYFYAPEQTDTTREVESLKIIQETFEKVTQELLESDELLRIRTKLKELNENIPQKIKELENPPESDFQIIKNDLDNLDLQKATINKKITDLEKTLHKDILNYSNMSSSELAESIKKKESRVKELNQEVINLQKEITELDSGSSKTLEVQLKNANQAIEKNRNVIEEYDQQIEKIEGLIKALEEEAKRQKPQDLDYNKEFPELTLDDIRNVQKTFKERIKKSESLKKVEEEKEQVKNELKDLEEKQSNQLAKQQQAVKRVNQYNRSNIKLEELKKELEDKVKAVKDQEKIIEKLKSEPGNVGAFWNSEKLNNENNKLSNLKINLPRDPEGLLKAIDTAIEKKSYAQEINDKKDRLKQLELDEAAHKINDRNMKVDSELITLEYSKGIHEFTNKKRELQNSKERFQANLERAQKEQLDAQKAMEQASQIDQQKIKKTEEINEKNKTLDRAEQVLTRLKRAQEEQRERESLENQLSEVDRKIRLKSTEFSEEKQRQELEEDQRKKEIRKLNKEKEQVKEELIQLMTPAERRATIVLLQDQLENPILSDEVRKKIEEELQYHQNELLHPQIFSFKSKAIPNETFIEKAANMASSAMKWAQNKIGNQTTQPAQKAVAPLAPAKPFEPQKDLLPEQQAQKLSLLHPVRSYKAWRENRARKALEKSEQKIKSLLEKTLRTATPDLDLLKDLEIPLEAVKRTSDDVLHQEGILKKVGAATYIGNIMNVLKAGRDTYQAGTKLIEDRDKFISYKNMPVRQYAQESRRIQREGGMLTKAVEEQFRDDRLIKEAEKVENKLLKKYPKIITQIEQNIAKRTDTLRRIEEALQDINTTQDPENQPQREALMKEREQLHKEIFELEVKHFEQHSNYLQLMKDQNQEIIYQLQQPHSPGKKALLAAKLEQNEEVISNETLESARRLNKYINKEETNSTLKNIREEYGKLITEYMQQQSRYQQEKDLLENKESTEAIKTIDEQLEKLRYQAYFKKVNRENRIIPFIKLSEATRQGRTLLQQKKSYTKPRIKQPAQPTPFDQKIENLEKNIAELKETTQKVRSFNYNVILRFFKDPDFDKQTLDKINRTLKEKVTDAYQAFKRVVVRVSSLTNVYYKKDELLLNTQDNNRARNKLERKILSSYKELSENLLLAQNYDKQQLEKANKLLSMNPDNPQVLKMRSDIMQQIQERDTEIDRVTQERIQLHSEHLLRLSNIIAQERKPEDLKMLIKMQEEAEEAISDFTKKHERFLRKIDDQIEQEPRAEEKIDLMRLRVQKMHDYGEFAQNITALYNQQQEIQMKFQELSDSTRINSIKAKLQNTQEDIRQYLITFFEKNPAIRSKPYPAQSLQEELDKMKKLEWEIKQGMLPPAPAQQKRTLDSALVEPLKYGLAIQTP